MKPLRIPDKVFRSSTFSALCKVDKINSFANKTKNILSKIGIDLGFGEIGKLAEIKFAKQAEVKSVVGEAGGMPQNAVENLAKSAIGTAQTLTSQAQQNVTVNFNAAVTNPEDAKNVVIQGLKEFNRTNGALNRVITIE